MVTRAMDATFNSAVVGNSTSIPLQPESLDSLTGLKFVSLSMSGSGPLAAIAVARFFLRRHANAKTIVVAMDDGWCSDIVDTREGHPFPFWLYQTDFQYWIGLFTNASKELLISAFDGPERGSNRLDGYHPYDALFRANGYDDIEYIKSLLDKPKRPTDARYGAPYHFYPPKLLKALIDEAPNASFVLFWTPRYVSIIPQPNSTAAGADAACKAAVGNIFPDRPNVAIVDWSEERPENADPANFYETNHYRDSLARIIEIEIAAALRKIH